MSDIIALEQQIAVAKGLVEQRDRMVRLTDNTDFRALVTQGYLKDECARFTHLSTEPSMSKDDRADALASAQACGHFKRWVNALILMGNRAEQDIVDMQNALAELRSEPEE